MASDSDKAKQIAPKVTKAMTKNMVPEPMIYRFVEIPRHLGDDPDIQIGYTDCVESSFLRLLQLLLSTSKPSKEAPSVATVDLDYLRSICDDQSLIDFFQRHPDIVYESDYYDQGSAGFAVRAEWCAYLTRQKPRFTYVRTGKNIFEDDLVAEGHRSLADFDFQFEVDATVRNIMALFTGAFPALRAEIDLSSIRDDIDETETYLPHFSAVARLFSRPERNFQLDFRVSKRYVVSSSGDVDDESATLFTQVIVGVVVNGFLVWKWATQRKRWRSVWLGAHSEINEA